MIFCLILYLVQLIGDLIVLHCTQAKGSNKKANNLEEPSIIKNKKSSLIRPLFHTDKSSSNKIYVPKQINFLCHVKNNIIFTLFGRLTPLCITLKQKQKKLWKRIE